MIIGDFVLKQIWKMEASIIHSLALYTVKVIHVSEYSKASHLYDLQFCREKSRSVLLYLVNSLDYNQCAAPQTGGSASNFIYLLSLSFA